MCCNVLQCVQCGSMWFMCCNVLQCVAMCCNVFALCCNVCHCVSLCFIYQYFWSIHIVLIESWLKCFNFFVTFVKTGCHNENILLRQLGEWLVCNTNTTTALILPNNILMSFTGGDCRCHCVWWLRMHSVPKHIRGCSCLSLPTKWWPFCTYLHHSIVLYSPLLLR